MIHRIIYASSAKSGLTKKDIEDILDVCRRNNSTLNITGVLFFSDGEFVQVLEGRKSDIQDLFSKISKDDRHENIEILIDEDVDNRYFSQWAMAYAVMDENDFRSIGGSFDIRTISDFKTYLQRPDAYIGSIFSEIIDRILDQ